MSIIVAIPPYIQDGYTGQTNRSAQLFSPFVSHRKNVGRVLAEKRIPMFLYNGTDAINTVASISKNADAEGIEIDLVTPQDVPARSSKRVVLSIVYGGPAVYHAVVTFESSSGSSATITIDGTRADPYNIAVEVGNALNKLIIRGGTVYGWPDAGVEVTLPFSLVQDTEYFFELSWNHTTGAHSIYIDGVLVGTVSVATTTAGVINRIIPGSYNYLKPGVASVQVVDNLVLTGADAWDLSKIAGASTSPRTE